MLLERAYQGESDKDQMLELTRQSLDENVHVVDMPYRLCSWAFDEPENIHLWFDENQKLTAWAALQTPFWTMDYVMRSYDSLLHNKILKWADERAKMIINTPHGRPAWYITIFEDQKIRVDDLETAGFACQSNVGDNSWSQVFMKYAGERPPSGITPPAGFIVRSLAGENEVDGYVEAHQSAFQSRNMTVEWRSRTLKHPAYKPDLDIVVESPDKKIAAFCICWFDEVSKNGQIEPLGRHKDFRGLGLGRVALLEGLRRLHDLGAKNIYVETDNFRDNAFKTYESAGFKVVRNILVYRKDYEQSA